MSYSPHLRTAVLLAGTGTAGAYHAGALRALQEAGVKIDVMAGRGIGVAGALFAAIDASPRTWEDGGIWRSRAPLQFYRWRGAFRWVAAMLVAACAILVVPLAVLAAGTLAYPLGFLVQMIAPAAGQRLVTAYARAVEAAFLPSALPTLVPRLITLVLIVALLTLEQARCVWPRPTSSNPRRYRGPWWERLVGPPWTAAEIQREFQRSLWQLFRGVVPLKQPSAEDLGRRYTELLLENLGQPGFRELVLCVHDLDAGRDLVFALLADRPRHTFFQRKRAGAEGGGAVDLTGVGRTHVFDALAGGLSLPGLTEPHVVTFAPEGYWRGEGQRLCYRPAAVGRLLHDRADRGCEQVIGSRRLRAGAAQAQHSARDAASRGRSLWLERGRRARAYATNDDSGPLVIRPPHNPIGPSTAAGTTIAPRVIRRWPSSDRGYADACREFIDRHAGAES